MALRAWSSEEEDAAHLVHLDLLKKELERVLRSRHNNLLQEVFKKLIDLVLFQVLLDRLHVVELLHFVHLAVSNEIQT